MIRDCGKGRMLELDECGCCTRCTKSVGEPCGGLEQLKCSPGQYCAHRPGRTFGYFRIGFCEPSKSAKYDRNMHAHILNLMQTSATKNPSSRLN